MWSQCIALILTTFVVYAACQCPDGQYSNGGTCTACNAPNCATGLGTTITCTGPSPSTATCSGCKDGYQGIACDTCDDGYYEEDGTGEDDAGEDDAGEDEASVTCTKCTTPANCTGVTSCTDGTEANTECSGCQDGLYLDGDNKCQECTTPSGCATGAQITCTGPSADEAICSSCKPGYVGDDCDGCDDGYYEGVDGEDGSVTCTQCTTPANCTGVTSCTDGTEANTDCSGCQSGFYLNGNDKCVECTTPADCTGVTSCTDGTEANTDCSGCQSGFYLNSDSRCTACNLPANCLNGTCSSSASGDCSVCQTGFTVDSNGQCERSASCGNGELDDGEECDDASDLCENCECVDGSVVGETGSCEDIDECSVYTCAFLGPDDVTCTTPALNSRVCRCNDGDVIDGDGDSQVTLTGPEPFSGCSNVEKPSLNEIIDFFKNNKAAVGVLISQSVPGAQVGTINEPTQTGDNERILDIGFTSPDGSDTSSLAPEFKNTLVTLVGINEDDVNVAVDPQQKRSEDHQLVVTFSNVDAYDSAGYFVASLVLIASVMLYQLF